MTVPELADYITIAQQGRMTPVYRVALADWETPVSAFYKVAAQEPYAFLLESVTGGEQIARYSYIGFAPTVVLRTKGRTARVWERDAGWREFEIPPPQTPLDIARALLRRYPYQASPNLPRFTGGLVGFLSYDLVRFFERLPHAPQDSLHVDDCCLIAPEVLLIFDHALHTITVLVNPEPSANPNGSYQQAIARIDETLRRLRTPLPPPPRYEDPQFTLNPQPNIARAAFEAAVRKTVDYIHAGDCIQVVLSQRFSQPISTPPFYLYRALRTINPSPYMFYLQFDDTTLIGASPEVLATVEDGKALTRPIAGTRPRGKTPDEDARLAEDLLADPKERAEHIMLVDLGRNDIGRVSVYGTVRTTELMVIERYSHVMHIVSEVQGLLRPDADAFDVLQACFPAGTVSGAPKVRAMEIIDELEPTQRGPYAGAVGYFSYTNEMDACITIRTILVKDNVAHVQAGAGIVADSVPEREYEECLNKARAALTAIERAHKGLE
ncbi:MAG: anthranilate synthase component I [Fimbriimonadales bacterium]|nr:anthranilate synthase component I [Fimbriimonadales bacterium]